MTQDEIIRMARELATRHGIRMCDEDGDTHGEELYCVGVEDIAEIIKQVAAHEREKQAEQEPIENNDWKKASYIRETLNAEQAEQEPVAWAYIDADGSFMDALDRQHGVYQTPLYAAPVRTKDLTDDEIHVQAYEHLGFDERGFYCGSEGLCDFARGIIQKHKEKNNA